MLKQPRYYRQIIGVIISLLMLIGCSSESSTDPVADVSSQTRIEGLVFDQTNGQAIRDAIVRTDPPTEEVSTSADGSFVLTDTFNGEGTIQVIVEHISYEPVQTTVAASAGLTTRADIAMQNSAIGLHASAALVGFTPDVSRQSLRLSSNVQNTGYSILLTEPWLTVTPSGGVIFNRESAVLQIQVDRSALPERLPAEAEIVINSDNGTRELVITVVVEGEEDSTSSALSADQSECRRNDVLRVGQNNQDAPLVQFAPSVQLPGDEGPRSLEISNPFLIDSIVVTELGTLSLVHTSGGSDNTSLELFDMTTDNRIRTIATNSMTSPENLRASLEWALIPGVYCYFLGDTNTSFDQTVNIRMDIGFTPAQ